MSKYLSLINGKKHQFSYNELWDEAKEIYDILLEIKNN